MCHWKHVDTEFVATKNPIGRKIVMQYISTNEITSQAEEVHVLFAQLTFVTIGLTHIGYVAVLILIYAY